MKRHFCLRRLLVSAVVFSLMLLQVANADGTVNLGSFDLVDSGKHLDWGGTTNYYNQLLDAINTWNNYKSGVIRKDKFTTIKDVSISDVYTDTVTIVTVTSSGKIKFNQRVIDTYTYEQKVNACLTAIGLALGLGTTSVSTDVMYHGKCATTALSVNDKASYDAAYKKY